MKKISKSAGAEISEEKSKVDYFEIYRNTPSEKKKLYSFGQLVQDIKQARAEKLKKAF